VYGNKAFVDGGVKSPYATDKNSTNPLGAQPGEPYYLTPDEIASGLTWDGMNGSITTTDRQNGGYGNDVSNFYTIVVATNYNGSGMDKLLGGFNWGYSNYQLQVNGANVQGIFRVLSNSDFQSIISPNVIQVIRQDYPNYKFTK
jgi:hypothetical protein